ncbi:MAG: response regulator [Granulosicoccus sp.]
MSKPIKLALLIDDSEIDQRLYKRVLNKSGLVEEVRGFAYADEALDYLLENPQLEVSVIFLDINMPRMNGFEFLEAASKQLEHDVAKVVVVMLTTSLNPDDENRARSFEAVKDFVSKPLSYEDVQKVVDLLSE